jgi:rhodanese-related sulfurtransferase
MRDLVRPVPLGPKTCAEQLDGGDAILLDVRSYPAFSGLHIPGSWHIDLSGNFATQAGWILPPDRDIILVADERFQVEEATLQLHRVGFDRITGYLDGGMLAWGVNALPVGTVPVISPKEAHALVEYGDAVIIDVRSREEQAAAPVNGAIPIPWHDLRTRYPDLDPSRHYIVMCKGGQRASIGASILRMQGFSRVSNLAGGFIAYNRAGFVP